MATSYLQQHYYTGKGPLDLKNTPVKKYSDLARAVDLTQRYVGLTVTVLNEDTTNVPCEYWLVGGTMNSNWRIKQNGIIDTYAHLIAINPNVCTKGMEMVVQNDESNNGAMTKYWVTNIDEKYRWEDEEGNTGLTPDYSEAVEMAGDEEFVETVREGVTWSRKIYGTEVIATIEDTVDMLMNKKYGNVVYTTDKVYSYSNDSGDTVWTSNVDDIPEGTEYSTYDDGLYAITEKNGETTFEKVVTTETGGDSNVGISGSDME